MLIGPDFSGAWDSGGFEFTPSLDVDSGAGAGSSVFAPDADDAFGWDSTSALSRGTGGLGPGAGTHSLEADLQRLQTGLSRWGIGLSLLGGATYLLPHPAAKLAGFGASMLGVGFTALSWVAGAGQSLLPERGANAQAAELPSGIGLPALLDDISKDFSKRLVAPPP